jgi:hypothetical protein
MHEPGVPIDTSLVCKKGNENTPLMPSRGSVSRETENAPTSGRSLGAAQLCGLQLKQPIISIFTQIAHQNINLMSGRLPDIAESVQSFPEYQGIGRSWDCHKWTTGRESDSKHIRKLKN